MYEYIIIGAVIAALLTLLLSSTKREGANSVIQLTERNTIDAQKKTAQDVAAHVDPKDTQDALKKGTF